MVSTLSNIEDILLSGDIEALKRIAEVYAQWKSYWIFLCHDDSIRVFLCEQERTIKEQEVTHDLIFSISTDVGMECDSSLSKIDQVRHLIDHINRIQVEIKLIRTIHAVGQGAFYSEHFLNDKGETVFRTVYDCGAQSSSKLKHQIKSSFLTNEEINLLFISHLDNDHVNGIVELKRSTRIKIVVLPLLDDSLKNMYLVFANPALRQILLSPQDFFNGSHIIYVKAVERGKDIVNGSIDLSIDNPLPHVISSGTNIICSSVSSQWCYVPYNYDDVNRITEFSALMQKYGINPNKLNAVSEVDIYQPLLKKAYVDVCNNSNNSSLVLYSGGCTDMFPSRLMHESLNMSRKMAEGCLYLGDVNLNQKESRMSLMEDLMLRLQSVVRHIGVIQLPHHGSKCNFHPGLFSMGLSPKVFFASFGTTNSFGHPSAAVIGQVLAANEHFCPVTEKHNSALVQVINVG